MNGQVGPELNRKIDELRSDPTKRAELEERIQNYKVQTILKLTTIIMITITYVKWVVIIILIIMMKENKLRLSGQQRNVLEENKDMTRHSPEVRALAMQEQVFFPLSPFFFLFYYCYHYHHFLKYLFVFINIYFSFQFALILFFNRFD